MFKDGRGLRQQAGRRLPALWRMYRVRHMRCEWLLQTTVSPVSQVGRQRAPMWVPVVNLSRTIVHKWFRYSPVTAFKSVSSTQHWFLFTGHWLLFKLYSLTLILPIAVACQMCHEHCNANSYVFTQKGTHNNLFLFLYTPTLNILTSFCIFNKITHLACLHLYLSRNNALSIFFKYYGIIINHIPSSLFPFVCLKTQLFDKCACNFVSWVCFQIKALQVNGYLLFIHSVIHFYILAINY